jgi:hypothetical protein
MQAIEAFAFASLLVTTPDGFFAAGLAEAVAAGFLAGGERPLARFESGASSSSLSSLTSASLSLSLSPTSSSSSSEKVAFFTRRRRGGSCADSLALAVSFSAPAPERAAGLCRLIGTDRIGSAAPRALLLLASCASNSLMRSSATFSAGSQVLSSLPWQFEVRVWWHDVCAGRAVSNHCRLTNPSPST